MQKVKFNLFFPFLPILLYMRFSAKLKSCLHLKSAFSAKEK